MNTAGSPGYIWKSIRVELAESRDYPRGSASRAYTLHLPLRLDGTVDEAVLRANPKTGGFQRFWPNEPDRSGFILPAGDGWALSFRPEPDSGERQVFPIVFGRLLPGDTVSIRKSGRTRTFRVVDL